MKVFCECRFKGSRATPIITKLCDYHRAKLRIKVEAEDEDGES